MHYRVKELLMIKKLTLLKILTKALQKDSNRSFL